MLGLSIWGQLSRCSKSPEGSMVHIDFADPEGLPVAAFTIDRESAEKLRDHLLAFYPTEEANVSGRADS